MPKKPIQVLKRHISKKERIERIEGENKYKCSRLRLVPPDELTERAKDKFEMIANEAFWLDELSTDLLAAYCQAWDRWLDLVAEMKNQTDTFISETEDGVKMRSNPNRTALLQYVNTMQQLSGKLGLGNIDRLKLTLPELNKKEENPFDEFMAAVE